MALQSIAGRVPLRLLGAIGGVFALVYLIAFLVFPGASPPRSEPEPEVCDDRCERERLHELVSACTVAPELGCIDDAHTAEEELVRGRCGRAAEALARLGAPLATTRAHDAQVAALAGIHACRSEELDAGPYLPVVATAIRYRDATTDSFPLRFDGREHITRLSLARDGALFLLTKSLHPQICTLYELKQEWAPKRVFDGCDSPSIAARSRDEIWLADHEQLQRSSGQHWQSPKVIFPEPVGELVASGNDLFAITGGHIEHAANDDWTTEKMPEGLTKLAGGGRPVGIGDGWIATRESDNAWHRRSPVRAKAAWSNEAGTIFVIDDGGAVLRSTDHGQSFRDLAAPEKVSLLTGTRDDDVYAAGKAGVFRFDGKTWTRFGTEHDVIAIVANPSEVWVVGEPHPR